MVDAAVANTVRCMSWESRLLGDLVNTCRTTPARVGLVFKNWPTQFNAEISDGSRNDSKRSGSSC